MSTLYIKYNVKSNNMRTFGENLKTERMAKKLSQIEFANLLGVSQQQVSQWELNKVEPTLSNIIAIISILEIDFEDLIFDIDIDKYFKVKYQSGKQHNKN